MDLGQILLLDHRVDAILGVLAVFLRYVGVVCKTQKPLQNNLVLLIAAKFHRLCNAVVQIVGHEEKVDFFLDLSTGCWVEI